MKYSHILDTTLLSKRADMISMVWMDGVSRE